MLLYWLECLLLTQISTIKMFHRKQYRRLRAKAKATKAIRHSCSFKLSTMLALFNYK